MKIRLKKPSFGLEGYKPAGSIVNWSDEAADVWIKTGRAEAVHEPAQPAVAEAPADPSTPEPAVVATDPAEAAPIAETGEPAGEAPTKPNRRRK